MSTEYNTLYITTSDRANTPEDQFGLVIDHEMKRIDRQKTKDLIFRLRRADIEEDCRIPIYRLLSHQLWRNNRQRFGAEPKQMHKLIPLYNVIKDKIRDKNIEKVVCKNVHTNYYLVVEEVCEEEDILLVGDTNSSKFSSYCESIAVVTKGILYSCYFLLDQLFALLLNSATASESKSDSKIAVMFPVNRPKVFQPLYRDFELDFDTIYTLRVVGYVVKYHKRLPQSANVRFLANNLDIKIFYREIKTLFFIYYQCLFSKSQPNDIARWIRDEEDANLDRLVQRLYSRTVLLNIDTIFTYILASHFFEQNNYEKLLVPGISRTSKGLSYAAYDQGVEIFFLPHGAGINTSETVKHTRFTPGKIATKHIHNSKNEDILPITTGYPKHQEILKQRIDLSNDKVRKHTNVVLIATQPFTKQIRTKFIQDVLDTLLEKTEYEIIIKTHPGEKPKFYHKLLQSNYEKEDTRRISVKDDNLYERLYSSIMTVTVTSSVGIESIIMETPVASYNPFPDLKEPLYVEYGSVPQCTTREELSEFVSNRNATEMMAEQEKMLYEDYMVYNNSVKKITQRIQSELADVD